MTLRARVYGRRAIAGEVVDVVAVGLSDLEDEQLVPFVDTTNIGCQSCVDHRMVRAPRGSFVVPELFLPDHWK